ncbi:hypothetical protein PFICI_07142 [Pestalotiopsis fici W106-1]|uniref:Chromo domain-containing protein n=1 Tax=Pestalotiopsis fici (strain W106-1 / CGMCC3.15140) TaxID=1229662 RepID=W3X7V7_PESFW|nr:uncharacterized protein PFICI_07142 [Pestalotiopsis fici W106-1]ETS82140.1 hypothetical protein PFICI_07142 [Pestalotiopsis fici W106-1]
MPSPVSKDDHAREDEEIPQVASDLIEVNVDNQESGKHADNGLSLELNTNPKPSDEAPKKRGRPSKKGKKLPSTPIKTSSPVLEKMSSKKATPTVVRLSEGDNDEDDSGNDSGEVNVEFDLPAISELFSKEKRARELSEDDNAGELEVRPKKRGRTSKNVKTAIVEQENEGSQPARKPRGRPRKSASAAQASDGAKKSAESISLSKKSDKSASPAKVGDHAPRRSSRAASESAKVNMSEQTKKQKQPAIKTDFLSSKGKNITQQPARRGRGRPKKETFFAVEKLVNKKVDKGGVTKYHVKWENYADTENTWEPVENLKGCMHLVEAYDKKEARNAKRPKKTKKA